MKTIPKHTFDFLDSWLELRLQWADIPGFVVAISKDGQLLFNKAYGYANAETKEKLRPDHVFRIASYSKTFTATAIMQLQEKGSVRIDDTIATHLTWLNDHTDIRWRDVTIRQLMSHSAGVTRDGLDSDYWQLIKPFPDRDTLKRDILATKLILEPNTKMKYSNYGYSLLGLLIEEVTGMSYGEYIQENIINTLGLSATRPDYDATLPYTAAHSRLTIARTRHLIPNPMTHAMAAATGVSSTASDLCQYFSAHAVGSGALLSDESKREMQRQQWPVEGTRVKTSYGLGFEHGVYGGMNMVGHGGGFPGNSTTSMFHPDDNLVVVVLTNTNAPVGELFGGVINVITTLGEEGPQEDLLKFETRYADLWGIYEVVVIDKTIKGIWSNSWYPFGKSETLEKIDETTLRIVETDGFSSSGEEIHYMFNDDGSIHHIVNAGSYAIPSRNGDVPVTWK